MTGSRRNHKLAWVLALGAGVLAASAADAADKPFTTGSSDVLIKFVDEKITQGWTDNEVKPSDVAEDEEWLRRVYLDIVGHIPPAEVVDEFAKDKDAAKRSKLIEKLLDDPAYVRNWSTVWTNLCVGRGNARQGRRLFFDRNGMKKFFREAFAKNRPWNEVVFDLVSGEGDFKENHAVNYLLAQLPRDNTPPDSDDYMVQATAKTTKLFMGIQVQCTQCHNHPFNDWQQDQFWQFNSFFRQVRKDVQQEYNERMGRMVDVGLELKRRDYTGPVFFEKRSGEMKVAYPEYFGSKVEEDAKNRREQLAKLMTQGDTPWIARAMVNRTWSHFFGYGFTRPVDDMGPHNAASHPALLDRLTEEFVKSRYDVKQLIRWITNSEAYNLTSQFGRGNEIDKPSAGEVPLFSHMYVKTMSPEQLYDSLIISTSAHKSGRSNWSDAEAKRQQWMQQFIVAFGTDENDESTMFNGTIPQALMMMNSELVQNAVNTKPGSYLHDVLVGKGSDMKKLQTLYLSTLGRRPSRTELGRFNKIIRTGGYNNKLYAYQDVFWALLNSNEFIMNH